MHGLMTVCLPPVGAVLPAIVKVLRTLKATEDATSEPATQNMYLLCDTALALATAIVDVHSPGTATAGKYPGSIPLPKTFFRQLDLRQLKSELPRPPPMSVHSLSSCIWLTVVYVVAYLAIHASFGVT